MSPSPLPVALITPAFPPDRGGLALAAARLARGLKSRLPLDIIVLGRTDAAPSITLTANDGIPVLRVTAPAWTEVQQQAFRLLVERGPWRCLHAIYPSLTGFPAALAARFRSTPFLVAARGNDLHRDSFRPDRQAGLLFALRHADAVAGVSRELCQLSAALGASGWIRWIPNGVDSEQFRPAPPDSSLLAEPGLAAMFPRLGFAGEARHKKGLATMLRALLLLRRRYPRAGLLLIGGVRADARPALAAMLDRHPELRSAVRELPWLSQDRLAGCYALLDAFWHPAISDGLPNAVLEALACGRPAIASRAGGAADILADSPLAGLLTPPDDPLALAETTLRLLQLEPAARSALGLAGRDWVMARFGIEAEVEAYLTLYAELDALRAARPASHRPPAAVPPPDPR